MPTVQTYNCPACNQSVRYHAASCAHCGQDVEVLALLNEVPDRCFNAALAAAKNGDWATAQKELTVALHYRDDDVAASVLLGKVLARQGRMQEAALAFVNARLRAPRDPKIAEFLRACGTGDAGLDLGGVLR
jgi:Flp pilus assembly protein TadD